MPKSLKQATADLAVTAAPNDSPQSNKVRFQHGPNGRIILWYYNNYWEGRCIAPHILTAVPTMTALVQYELAIVVGTTTQLYYAANAGSSTWTLYTPLP
ncbi:MAG: hypothetical protein ACRC62_21410 [Microcoleus sp.]